MGNFNRGGRSDFRRSSGRRDDRPMYQATCSECGQRCEVPFKPTGSKPVLCGDCFRGNRSDDRGGRDTGRRDFVSRDRPHFRREEGMGGKSAEHFDQQFALLNEKLDKILKRLTPTYMRNQTDETDETESDTNT